MKFSAQYARVYSLIGLRYSTILAKFIHDETKTQPGDDEGQRLSEMQIGYSIKVSPHFARCQRVTGVLLELDGHTKSVGNPNLFSVDPARGKTVAVVGRLMRRTSALARALLV